MPADRHDPFAHLPPHVAAQYAHLRGVAAFAEVFADLIVLTRDFTRAAFAALFQRRKLPVAANSDIKSAPLASATSTSLAANSDRAPRRA